jgi:hypothetical protein
MRIRFNARAREDVTRATEQRRETRRHRERKRLEREAADRFNRGLPPAPEPPPVPDGAYRVGETDIFRAGYGHYAAKDGTFPPIPTDIPADLPDWHQKQLARGREPGTPNRITADISILFEE